ncbi:MAG TPA: pyrroloquinoline quinone biosynthesis protein PqqE [Pseudomonadales bacterium]|nr:pyrroloquinoline quinone biosynthesis protein PqqE [Pseudomonadales bacterium]
MAGSQASDIQAPRWLLAELTYRCPLQCGFCSNPLDFSRYKNELSTEQWLAVFQQARELGAVQLGLSGGEPLVRQDLDILIREARQLGYYTNLITSTLGMNEARLEKLHKAGLDHVQVSFQAADAQLNDAIAGAESFSHKKRMTRAIKALGLPVVLNIVIHKDNIDFMSDILDMCLELGVDYVELASAQYYGYALKNRDHLLPSLQQVRQAEAIARDYQQKYAGVMKVFYVIPDYYENRPKPCMNGWGNLFLTVDPEGTALPCHSAKVIPDLSFPNVTTQSLRSIWFESAAFNVFRGDGWMKEPCKSCDEKTKDFGGCRCQAYLLTGDAYAADPACDKAPGHAVVEQARCVAAQAPSSPVFLRNRFNSDTLTACVSSTKSSE